MENDYLWNKTGKDHEIERLEKTLREFRYQPTATPVLPPIILDLGKKSERARFRSYFLRLAFATTGLVVAAVSIWLLTRIQPTRFVGVEEYSSPERVLLSQRKRVPDATVQRAETTVTPTKYAKPDGNEQNIRTVAFRPKSKRVRATKTPRFSIEEQTAFNQLMLALSITGSKLREVKDKVNGIDEPIAAIQKTK